MLAVLLTGFTAAALLHTQIQNDGRRPTVTSPTVASPPAPGPATAPHTPAAASAGLAGLRWADFYGIALPVSTHDGPRDTRDGLASGFADTPTGALLAAINIGVRAAAQWGPRIYRPTITRQVTGPDAAALLANQNTTYQQLRAAAHVPPGRPAGRGYAAIAAYRLITYTPNTATIDIVSAGPATNGITAFAATRIQVVWRGGDWRVVAPPGGDWRNAATAISSPVGYTPFPSQG